MQSSLCLSQLKKTHTQQHRPSAAKKKKKEWIKKKNKEYKEKQAYPNLQNPFNHFFFFFANSTELGFCRRI